MKKTVGVLIVVFLVIAPAIHISVGSSASFSLYSVIEISSNSLSVTFNSACPVVINSDGYTATSDTLEYEGVEYEGVAVTNDANTQGGISSGTFGTVNVRMTLDTDERFCFAIYYPSGLLSTMSITVTIDGTSKSYSPTVLGGDYGYIGTRGMYDTVPELDGADDWFSSASTVSIRITNQLGIIPVPKSVTFSVLFEP